MSVLLIFFFFLLLLLLVLLTESLTIVTEGGEQTDPVQISEAWMKLIEKNLLFPDGSISESSIQSYYGGVACYK